jgi:hypothetical protein
MSTPEPAAPEPSPRPAGLPPSPWTLLDRTTVTQTARLLELLAEWLLGADSEQTECAHHCSHGEADAFEVAAWADTLAAHLDRRVEASDTANDGPEVDSWS